jgi:dTDP-4-amino-4,6-dideoxygalactose transaminase
MRVPFLAPTFPSVDDVAADYEAILDRGIFSNGGPVERRFAESLAQWTGGNVGVSLVSSGTAGLELAINATFDGERTDVLVASFTFAAGPLAILRCGFAPVFLDVDPETWQPSLTDAREFLESHEGSTAGILLTNTFGVANTQIGGWEELASRHGLALVVDSAAGFGSRYPSGEPLGARGTCEVFSLHATKTLAIGEGGAVSARDLRLIERIDRIKNFGFDSSRASVEAGTNAKLSELSCAIGLRQLKVLPERLALRRRAFGLYERELSTIGIEFQPSAALSALPFVSALIPSLEARDATLAALDHGDVECRAYYNPPVHLHPMFAGTRLASSGMPATLDLASRIVSLPMSDHLAAPEMSRIVQACREALGATAIHSN